MRILLLLIICIVQLSVTPIAPKRKVIASGGGADTTLYLAGNYGVAKSTDWGATWTIITNGMATAKNCIGVGMIGSTLYAATVDGGTGSGGQVYKSTDDGATWTSCSFIYTTAGINCMCILGNWIFIGTEGGGCYASFDNGASWVARNNGLSGTYPLKARTLIKYGTTLYYGTGGVGVYKSTDYGANWTQMTGKTTGAIMAIQADSANGLVYVGDYTAGTYTMVHATGVYTYVGNPCYYPYGFAIYSGGVFIGSYTYGVFQKTGSATWVSRNTGLTGNALYIRGMFAVAHRMYIMTISSVLWTTNAGANWSARSTNVSTWNCAAIYMRVP
jgi:photosystem II stability/assembly factor-like uncharacterized protein